MLIPLHYHRKLKYYFTSEEKKTWDWFASVQIQQEQLQSFQSNLLKNTYRLDRSLPRQIVLFVIWQAKWA